MSFAGRLLLEFHHSLKGSRSLAMLREMRSTPFKSRAELQEDQFRRLSGLLAHAEAHVPYYREMFRNLGIRSQDIRSLRDFSVLPVLTKDIVRERINDLIADNVSREKLIKGHTGGSTGMPLSFYHDSSYDDAAEAAT